jgi:hypothetical protein
MMKRLRKIKISPQLGKLPCDSYHGDAGRLVFSINLDHKTRSSVGPRAGEWLF